MRLSAAEDDNVPEAERRASDGRKEIKRRKESSCALEDTQKRVKGAAGGEGDGSRQKGGLGRSTDKTTTLLARGNFEYTKIIHSSGSLT